MYSCLLATGALWQLSHALATVTLLATALTWNCVGQIHGFSTKLFCRSVFITVNKEHKATYNLPAAQLLKVVLAFTVTPELCRNLVLHTFSNTWFYQNFKYLKTWWLWLYFTASCWNPHKYQALEHSVGRLGITGSWLWEKMVSDS